MKKILLTGGSGYIGSNFIKRLKNYYDIKVVSLQKISVKDIGLDNIETIVHMAGLAHNKNKFTEEDYFNINTDLTIELAERAKQNGIKHFIYFSSVAVWGTHGKLREDVIIDIKTPVNPLTPYAKSKYKAELLLKKMETEEFKITIIRIPLVYSPDAPGNIRKLRNLIKYISILPFDFDNKRSYITIQSLIDKLVEIIDNMDYGTFILKDTDDISIKDLVSSLAKSQHKKVKLFKLPYIVIKIIAILKPEIIASLYGNLRFKEGKDV